MLTHSTTADREASGSSAVISPDQSLGYRVDEIVIKPSDNEVVLTVDPHTSLYCVYGRGWLSFTNGKLRYALEPGSALSAPQDQDLLRVSALDDLKILQISYAGTHSPWAT